MPVEKGDMEGYVVSVEKFRGVNVIKLIYSSLDLFNKGCYCKFNLKVIIYLKFKNKWGVSKSLMGINITTHINYINNKFYG